MKMRIFSLLLAGMFVAIWDGWGLAVPVPPAGRPKEIASFQVGEYTFHDFAFSPDGKTLASVGGEPYVKDQYLKLWDMASGKKLADIRVLPAKPDALAAHGVRHVAFSPDGKTVATSDDEKEIKFWDVATGTKTDMFRAVPIGPSFLFSPDGKSLIYGYDRLDLETKKARRLVREIKGLAPVVAFDRKGKLLLGTTFLWPNPPSFAIWDVETGKIAHTCLGRSKVIYCQAFSPDGKLVVSTEGDYDGGRWSIRLWDTATGKNTGTFDQPDLPYILVFNPSGTVLAACGKPDARRNDYVSAIRLLDVPSGKVLATLKGPKEGNLRQFGRLAFSPDGRLLAAGNLDGLVKIWRLPDRYAPEKGDEK